MVLPNSLAQGALISTPLNPALQPDPLGTTTLTRFSTFYATRATCHQNAAETAERTDNSGTAQAHPRQSPVKPAPTRAATKPRGLRMTRDRSPDQLQFQPAAQRRQCVHPPAEGSPRDFPAMGTTRPGGFPVRPVGVFPAGSAMHQCFHL
jgi:hypothetical protein